MRNVHQNLIQGNEIKFNRRTIRIEARRTPSEIITIIIIIIPIGHLKYTKLP